MRFSISILSTCLWLFSSCASQKGAENSESVNSSSSTAKERGLAEKLMGDYKMVQDKETGFTRIQTDKKNPFADKSNAFNGANNSANKEFNSGEYVKKDWAGAKDAAIKRWGGKRDFDQSPEFVRQNSQYGTSSAREATTDYSGVSKYRTTASREATSERLSYGLDDRVQRQQKNYVPPVILDNVNPSNSGRSVKDVKELLNE